MDILFIHGNYPGQFRHLVNLLAKNGHRIVFLTNNEDAARYSDKRISIKIFRTHRGVNPTTHHYLTSTEESILNGQAILREIIQLKQEGFEPRLAIFHGGMGYGMHLKEVIPNTRIVGYFEWYFRRETSRYLLPKFELDDALRANMRNLPILYELESCDVGVVPTKWQKRQFPNSYRNKLNTIFDGVDTSFFKRIDEIDLMNKDIEIRNRETKEKFILKADKKYISYATRGMESLRGFPEFMESLPEVLGKNSDLYIIIAGLDKRAYSYDAPSHGGSWKLHMLDKLGDFEGKDRIIFTGLLDYSDYRKLLWRTNIHCYLTRPYVTSWSLFEAASCGAQLLVNINEATENIIVEDSATWVDLDKRGDLKEQMLQILDRRKVIKGRLKPGYDLESSLKKWENVLNECLGNSRRNQEN